MDKTPVPIPDTLLRRHSDFWRLGDGDSPLFRVGRYVPLERGGLSAGAVEVFSIDRPVVPEKLASILDDISLPDSVVEGDLVVGVSLPGMCWSEGYAGCRVVMGEGGAWADRKPDATGDVEQDMQRFLDSAFVSGTNPWLEAFSSCTARLVESVEGRCPVVQPLLRGPLDVMASAIGHGEMVTAFIDYPDLANSVLERSTDLFIDIARTHFEIAPPFAGGSVMFGMVNEHPTVRTQLDNSVLVSPEMFREQMAAQYRRIYEAFPASIMHVHSGGLHIIDELLSDERLTAIQVTRDFPGGPSVEELRPSFVHIQKHKPLVITGAMSRNELDMLLMHLSPSRLCLDVRVTD